MDTCQLRLTLIGEFSCRINGKLKPIKSVGSRQILVFLALARDFAVERDALAATLWPNSEKAKLNFRQALFQLRKDISTDGYELIDANRSLVKLQASRIITDVDQLVEDIRSGVNVPQPCEFSSLAAKLLYDFCGPNNELEDWLQMVRADFDNRLESALTSLLTNNPITTVRLAAAQCLLAVEATNELASRTAMQAYHSMGEVAKAVTVYNSLYQSLEDEFDLEPSKETQDLIVKIKLDDNSSSNDTTEHASKVLISNVTNKDYIGKGTQTPDHETPVFLNLKSQRPTLLIDAVELVNSGEIDIEALKYHIEEAIEEEGQGKFASYSYAEFCITFDNIPKAIAFAFSVQRLLQRIQLNHAHWPKLAVVDVEHYAESSLSMLRALSSIASRSDIIVNSAIADFLTNGIDANFEDIGEISFDPNFDSVRTFRMRAIEATHKNDIRKIENEPNIENTVARIAVIPFHSNDINSEFLNLIGDVLAEELNSQITLASNMTAISRLSARVFSNRICSLQEISSKLNCDYVISGYCASRNGKQYWFVELAAGETEEALWSTELQLLDVDQPEHRSTLCFEVFREVWSAIGKRAESRVRRGNFYKLKSHLLHTAALNLMNRMRKQDFILARKVLNELLDRDPRFAPALAALTEWRVMRAQQGWIDNNKREAKLAYDTATRAVDIDPDCSAALVAHGAVQLHFFHQMTLAEENYEAAIRANRNNGLAWLSKAALSIFMGDSDLAVKEADKAIEISPLDPASFLYQSIAAGAYCSNGQNHKALQFAEQAIKTNIMHASSLRTMIIANWRLGNYEIAKSQMERFLKQHPDFSLEKYSEYAPSRESGTVREAIEIFRSLGVPRKSMLTKVT